MPINHHGGSASPEIGHDPAGARRLHDGDRLVLAPGPLAPDLRRRLQPPPRPEVRPHRAGLRLGSRRPGDARLLPPGAGPPDVLGDGHRRRGHRRGRFGAGIAEAVGAGPSDYWTANCYRRRLLHAARRGAAAARRSASTRSCGAATTRTTRAPSRTRARRCGTPSRACRTDESRAMLGGNAARVYGFDLDGAATGRGAGRARRVAEIDEPLKQPPADATSPTFGADSVIRVW